MKARTVSNYDRRMAEVCRRCLVCRRARRNPEGLAATLVRTVEQRLCPFCRAYRRVYGRPAGDPGPTGT